VNSSCSGNWKITLIIERQNLSETRKVNATIASHENIVLQLYYLSIDPKVTIQIGVDYSNSQTGRTFS